MKQASESDSAGGDGVFRDSAGLLQSRGGERTKRRRDRDQPTDRPTDSAKEEAKKAAGGMTKGIKVLPHSTL